MGDSPVKTPESGDDVANKPQMTREWKNLVLETIGRRGWSIERLGEELGVARSLAYRLFPSSPRADEIWSSSVVPTVCELLGLPPPMEPTEIARDENDRRILEMIRALPPSAKNSLEAFIASLLEKPSG